MTPPTTPPATPSTIAHTPATLSFSAAMNGANPSGQTVSISHTGTDPLNWSASDGATWLTLSPASGTGNGTVTASVNVAGLAAGTHNATITIAAAGATNTPQTIPVTLTVAATPTPTVAPTIGLGASSLSFTAVQGGVNPGAQTVTINNTGTGTLNWSASDGATWLTLSPALGTGTGTVTASANVTGLAAGTYTTAVTITATGATNTPQTVPVTLTITTPATPAPTISRSPINLTFTASQGAANPANQIVTITNTGAGTLNWSATDNAAWLTLSPASGAGNGSVTASVSTAGLVAGSYTATVTIAATGATNTPQTVPVTLTVTAPATSSATLSWNPNTDADLAGYKVYRSTTSGVYGAPVATLPSNVTSYQFTSLQAGFTYFFVVSAYDSAGNESGFSTEVSKSIF